MEMAQLARDLNQINISINKKPPTSGICEAKQKQPQNGKNLKN